MKKTADIFTSLTRISDLAQEGFELQSLPRDSWENGDYVVCEIVDPGGNKLSLELPNGRMRGVIGSEWVMGALGRRHATLEATGTWEAVGSDLRMQVLTGAGLFGKLTSKSVFLPPLMQLSYRGHAVRRGRKLGMKDFVRPIPTEPFHTPVILFFGTSMSAGKTTSARIVTHLFKSAGYRVVGSKLTGAGRYKDILALEDVGADRIYDFVDVGLPSSICPPDEYRERLEQLLSRMARVQADIAVVEIGASPLEPYNGDIAIEALEKVRRFSVLSASDPYAVLGLMQAFSLKPDLVTGVASNTLAGIELVQNLCGVPGLNLIDAHNLPRLKRMLAAATGLEMSDQAGRAYAS